MNRNTQSPFANVPEMEYNRSIFEIPFNHKTTGNTGDLIPFYLDMDVLPGDTHSITTSTVIRSMTPLKPVMDLAYADTYFFFIPNRILWEHWKNLMGENTNSAWLEETEYTTPQLTTPSTGITKGTIADYMGIPTNAKSISINALPFRAYVKIYNEWFRDQNLIAPLTEYTDDTNRTMDMTNPVLGGTCCKVAKGHDYFTSALPQPQKGEPISIPLGTSAPIYEAEGNNKIRINFYTGNENNIFTSGTLGIGNTGGLNRSSDSSGANQTPAYISLAADLTQATASTINALRLSFQTQRMLEKDARGGSRYREIIKNHFGTTIPDATVQIPEYLGGQRIQISMDQVLQTADGTNSGVGNTGAMSLTNDINEDFTKSFTEHGIIIGLIAIRTLHTYQQGIEKGWFRKQRFDYYDPTFAYLGEQPIYNREIYATGTSTDTEIFGYQEAWADYRYKQNRISGEFRSDYALSLDVWHYGDDFGNLPTLGQSFIEETKNNVARTLAVQNQDQWMFDIAVLNKATRAMPINSVPGLIDHM